MTPATEPPRSRATGRAGALNPLVALIVAGWLFGGVEGAFIATKAQRAAVIAFGAVLSSLPAAFLGLAFWGVVVASRRLGLTSRVGAWFDRIGTRDPDADRAPVIHAHAFAASAFVALVGAITASSLIFPRLFDLQEEVLAKRLATGVAAALLCAALFTCGVGPALLRRPLGALDRRVRLPFPGQAAVLYLVLIALPAFVVGLPFLRDHGSVLGVLRDLVVGCLLACAGLGLALLGRHLPEKIARRALRPVAAIAVVLVIGAALSYGRFSVAAARAERGLGASMGARMGRALTDVDRDGTSSLFGGGDCAPLDRTRGPTRTEIYGNGIDEDCNGSDDTATRAASAATDRFSDALRPEQVQPYNVVWVVMETVRADHVGALGYGKNTMPYFDRLAGESLLFTRAFSQASATVLSIPSMLSGVDPGAMSWKRANRHPQPDDTELMCAERMKRKSYKTGLVLDTYLRHTFTGMHQGFDQLLLAEPDDKRVNNRPRRDLFSTASAASFLAKIDPDDRFFLVVYYPDTHSPYTRHKDIDSSGFDLDELGDYDTELAFLDEQLHALVEIVRARQKLWERTILIVTADHGEEFMEHGGQRHALTCYVESTHVPLLVRVPGVAPARVDTAVALVDIVPTVLELTGNRDEPERLSGRSLLLPALRPDKVDPSRPLFCSIASITDKYGTFFRRSVRQGNLTLIHDVVEGRYSLFDTASDPGERQDVATSPEHAARMPALKELLAASLTGNLKDHTKMW
jgi:choline-sulfatase